MAANGGAKGDAGMLVTGKIDLAKLSKPKFSFYVYNNTSQTTKKGNTNGIEVQARVAGDSVWTTLRKATVNELCNGDTSVGALFASASTRSRANVCNWPSLPPRMLTTTPSLTLCR